MSGKIRGDMAETSSFLLGISTQLDESDRPLEKLGVGVSLSGDHFVLFHSTSGKLIQCLIFITSL